MASSQLDEEIESWEGFPWALRREDRELRDAMIKEVKEPFGYVKNKLVELLSFPHLAKIQSDK